MFRKIDGFLNTITMYRLMLYYLLVLWGIALVFCVVGILPYDPLFFIVSAVVILAVCWITNTVFAKVYRAQTNVESVYITAVILALIITPLRTLGITPQFWFLVWASIWAMASKYILAIGKKHVFNPAAFGVAISGIFISQSASWWIGTQSMLPFVVIGGLLVTRKLIRTDMVITYIAASLAAIIAFGVVRGTAPLLSIQKALVDSALMFFAFVMLTEPLTTPPRRSLRIVYAVIAGFLFAPAVHIGSLYSTPELALLAANIFSYFVSPKQKLLLTLKTIYPAGTNQYDFVFTPDKRMPFRPGQYLEWTLGHAKPDTRGNRRYFTIASSPTESEIHMGVKFYPKPSTFKRNLASLKAGDTIMAGQLAGEFTLPKDPQQKLVFIAGGIGITPYRSMLKYLADKGERRPITLLYATKTTEEVAYRDVFDEAVTKLGITTSYIASDTDGMLDGARLVREVPDYKERMFYISGSHGMIMAFEDTLKSLGIPSSRIKTDFFPGFV